MDKPQTCSHRANENPSNQTCNMTNKQSTMPKGWFTNFVYKRQRDNKPEICTPVYNFSRLLTDASNSEIVRQKGHCLSSWSVYKCVSSLFRIQIVACEGAGVHTGFKGSLSTDRLRKLDKFKNSQEFETEIQEFIASENGIDRLQRMFQYDEVTNEYSAQLQLQVKLTAQTMTMFFIFGFLTKMPQEEKEFKKRNQLTMYATKRMASKRMYESIMLRRLKGGIMAVLFTCRSVLPILYIEQLLTVYFNKTNPLFMTFSAAALKRQTKILKAFMRSDVDFALKQGSLTQSQDVSQTPAQDALPTEGQEGSPSADQDTSPTAGQDSSPTAGQQQVKIHHQQQVNACCHQLVKIHHHP